VIGIRLHIAAGQGHGVGVVIVCEHAVASGLERVSHARGTGKEVDDRVGVGGEADGLENRLGVERSQDLETRADRVLSALGRV